MTTLEGRREVVEQMIEAGLSKRSIGRWSPWSRRIAGYQPKLTKRDAELLEQMNLMALLHPRFGYRRIAVMLKVSVKRVRRLWQKHGFRLGEGRPKRRLSGTNTDERPHRAEHADHVWTYDIIEDRLADGSTFRMLGVLDEYTRECLAIHVARSIRAADVIQTLACVMNTLPQANVHPFRQRRTIRRHSGKGLAQRSHHRPSVQ